LTFTQFADTRSGKNVGRSPKMWFVAFDPVARPETAATLASTLVAKTATKEIAWPVK
jgi:hypothetical protein